MGYIDCREDRGRVRSAKQPRNMMVETLENARGDGKKLVGSKLARELKLFNALR